MSCVVRVVLGMVVRRPSGVASVHVVRVEVGRLRDATHLNRTHRVKMCTGVHVHGVGGVVVVVLAAAVVGHGVDVVAHRTVLARAVVPVVCGVVEAATGVGVAAVVIPIARRVLVDSWRTVVEPRPGGGPVGGAGWGHLRHVRTRRCRGGTFTRWSELSCYSTKLGSVQITHFKEVSPKTLLRTHYRVFGRVLFICCSIRTLALGQSLYLALLRTNETWKGELSPAYLKNERRTNKRQIRCSSCWYEGVNGKKKKKKKVFLVTTKYGGG